MTVAGDGVAELMKKMKSSQISTATIKIHHHINNTRYYSTTNSVTYHSIIHKLSRARAFEPVETLLAELQKSGIKCGENLFIDVLRNYGLAGRPKDALHIFLRINDFGVTKSVRSLNTLLNVLIQNRKYELVHALFRNSQKKFNITPNVFTCNILLKAFCKNGDIEGALKVLDEMPAMGMVPNEVTYTTVLGAYVSRGDMANAKTMFDQILDRGWIPNVFTYNMLIKGFCKGGNAREGVKILEEMLGKRCLPNKSTFSILLVGLCHSGEEDEVMVGLSGQVIDADVWEILVTKFGSKMGEDVFDSILVKGAS
ncbi:hypothetical protein L1887_16329 [Cichorium endivia]|nr:hypothetical protein L1887_16329 [Cichorium endivia]